MRIVVFGTGPFAVPMFQSLLDSRRDNPRHPGPWHVVPALITRPTHAPKGRVKGTLNPMRDLAETRGVSVYAPESINSGEGKEILKSLHPELIVVCDYGQILSAEVLAISPLGGINLHASLLPKYRGAAPIHWALLKGESETGVSVIHMTPQLDSGPILASRSTLIGSDETQPELEARLAQLGIDPVHEAIGILARWDRKSPIGCPQDPSEATRAPRLKKQHGLVDWTKSAEAIRNQVRALKPWPGTYTFWHRAGHEPLRIVIDQVSVLGLGIYAAARIAQLEEQAATSEGESGWPFQPGQVIVADGKQLIVATGSGGLSISALAPAGKRHMSVAEFLRGYHIREGDVLGGEAAA